MRVVSVVTILVIIFGCSPVKQKVTFAVANASSSTIFVQYVENIDTVNVTILNNGGHLVSDFFLEDGQSTNWYNDYSIHFNSITNLSGDTVNFNPNEANNWTFYSQSSVNYYNLFIGDSSF